MSVDSSLRCQRISGEQCETSEWFAFAPSDHARSLFATSDEEEIITGLASLSHQLVANEQIRCSAGASLLAAFISTPNASQAH